MSLDQQLIDAVDSGNLEMVQQLLSQGADIHAEDDDSLIFAASNGHLSVVQYLVSQGANIHAQNDFALRFAATNGHLQMVQYLLLQGADLHIDNNGALIDAALFGHPPVVQYLLDVGADPFVVLNDPNKFSPDVIQFIQNWVQERQQLQQRMNLSLGYIDSAPPGYFSSMPQGGVGYQETNEYFRQNY